MNNLSENFNNLQVSYRKNFLEYAKFIQDKVSDFCPEGFGGDIFDIYEKNSKGRQWQIQVLNYATEILNNEIPAEVDKIRQMRNSASCSGCGICCRFAVSEFSYDELKQKAAAGDNFAKQFISTFIPYSSIEEASDIFPEYVEMLKNNNETGYYIYHCPKVTSGNRCPDYENRPQICRDFPDNPVAFLPAGCGYKNWKEKSETRMIKLRAMCEILNFYIEKLA